MKDPCLCCGCKTIEERGTFEICPVCFWEDDTYFDFSREPIKGIYVDGAPAAANLMDVPSAANHGLTLRQGRKNYNAFGACEKSMKPHVRKPLEEERI